MAPADRFTKKADTPEKKRQWSDVYNSSLNSGKSEKVAIMSANAAVRDHPAKSKSKPSKSKFKPRSRSRSKR